MPQSENQPPSEVSRGTIKRDMIALQKIGETLVEMPQSQLDKIPLPDELLDAINLARTLKSNEAKRRQLQYIGKIMRNIDVEPIQAALKKIQLVQTQATTKFHAVEEWRERLIGEGDVAIQTFINEHPDADRQQLRQLIRQAQHNRKSGKDTGAETMLFRYLRDFLE